MATNYPSPYVLTYTATTSGIVNKHSLACQVEGSPVAGVDFTTLTVKTASDGSVTLWLAIETFLGLIRKSYTPSTTLSGIELFKVLPNNDGRQFISAYQFSIVGDSGSTLNLAFQSVFTFRTGNGSNMRITYLEAGGIGNLQQGYDGIPLWEQNMVDYVLSNDNWIYASDNSYPVSFLRRSQGQNEALAKKRYRPNS